MYNVLYYRFYNFISKYLQLELVYQCVCGGTTTRTLRSRDCPLPEQVDGHASALTSINSRKTTTTKTMTTKPPQPAMSTSDSETRKWRKQGPKNVQRRVLGRWYFFKFYLITLLTTYLGTILQLAMPMSWTTTQEPGDGNKTQNTSNDVFWALVCFFFVFIWLYQY